VVFQYDQHLNDITSRYLKRLGLQSPFDIPTSSQPAPPTPTQIPAQIAAPVTSAPTQVPAQNVPTQTVGSGSSNYATPTSTPSTPTTATSNPVTQPTPVGSSQSTSNAATSNGLLNNSDQYDMDAAQAEYAKETASLNPGVYGTNPISGQPNKPTFLDWWDQNKNRFLKDAGSPDETFDRWLGTAGQRFNLTDQQKAYLKAFASDLYRGYQDSQLPGTTTATSTFAGFLAAIDPRSLLLPGTSAITVNGVSFPLSYSDANTTAYYLNYIDQIPGLTQDQKDQLKGQYQDLLSKYTEARTLDRFSNPTWANFLSGQNIQAILNSLPEAHPDLLYQNWVQNQNLSPVQQQELLSRFQPIYASFYAAQQQDPNLRFSDYLNSVNSQNQLALAPEQDTSQTYANFISHLQGITPQMRSTLENRYFPVYSNYLSLYNQNPQQYYSFSDYLNQFFNPQQVLSQVPNSAPVAANQTFANRLRWFGY